MPHELELTLDTGRSIRLITLEERFTYGWLLAGHATIELNRRMMDELIARHTNPECGEAPHLIEPVQTRFDVDPARAPHGTPARLPEVTCIGRFDSDILPGAVDDVGSDLVVIWFQSDFAPPIDPIVKSQLVALDWDALARGWCP